MMTPKTRMLVVEDDPEIRGSLIDQFVDQDFEVDAAATGREAMDFIRANKYQVILLDIKLPDMSGNAILTEMKTLDRLTPTIMVTGQKNAWEAMNALTLGAKHYLIKPYDPEVLLTIVNKIVETGKVV